MNTPFLQQVARHYLDAQGLEDYCFVFPNRRSGQFFLHDLQAMLVQHDEHQHETRPHLMPCVTSINELVASMTGTESATDIEMTFALYDAYCQVMGDRAQELDKFIYWSQLIINDFNDIDRSLADVHEIYQNLEDLHEISSNYLPDKVREKLKKIFGDNLVTAFFDPEADANLWRLFAGGEKTARDGQGDEQVKQEFMSLWNALEPIYTRYHEALASAHVVSPGKQLRLAVEGTLRPLRYSRLVFVGFGVLSAAEVKFFDHFRNDGVADFWWDNAGVQAMLDVAPHDPGALLIDGYCKRFNAMPIDPLEQSCQDLRVVAVPSAVGQAKLAFDELALMTGKPSQAGIETAIVLPDEGLLVPLLHSVHDVGSMNVTLGYPLRSSGIVSLMHIVARMHHQASKERGVWTYYREDVNDILSHPLIKAYFTSEALELSAELSRTNRFRVPAPEFEQASFAPLFRPALDSERQGSDREQHSDYLDNLLAFCTLLLDRMQIDADDADATSLDLASDGGVTIPLQQAFLVMYVDVLNQLKRALDGWARTLQRNTVFYLIDRLTAAAVVPFTGEPLRGLQIMGLLETRGLDFKNVVILSMNERVFPRRRSINSFIPNYMRRAHGMSTIEQQEAIVAFNFYRLLNRAEHVTLLYDSSAQKMGTSEPSRYIAQLEKIYGRAIQRVEVNPVFDPSSLISIQVPNKASLRDRYTLDPVSGGGHYLSASAINKFIACPLMFYLHYVQGLNEDNELSDFMDYGTFGDIIHDTLNECYYCEQSRARGGVIDKDYIVFFKEKRLEAAVVRNIKRHYLHVPEERLDNDDTPLQGEAFMLIDTIMSYVRFVLDYDLELIGSQGPITILECEKTHVIPAMRVGDVMFNFKYKPDRVDRLADGTVRIVDYKTGKDKTTFAASTGDVDLPDLFDPGKSDRRKAILQLFLYCYAYLAEHPEVGSVTPVIYKLASMDDSGVMMKGGRGVPDGQYVFRNDDAVAQRFLQQMASTVRSIYQEPFNQAPEGAMTCNHCRFIDFCRRAVTKFDF